jgi:hypothetical protein
VADEQVTISVDDAHRDRFAEVVQASERAGLQVEQQLEGIGVIVGRIERGKRQQLEQVAGVAAVEGARRIQIAPPESEVQ